MAALADLDDHPGTCLHIEMDGLVHCMKGYNRRTAVFEFHCGWAFEGNAHLEYETFDRVNCAGCAVTGPACKR